MAARGSDMKDWAREKLKGVENQLMPSFKPDMVELDEAGIRLDVRKTKEHGFVSTLCTCEAGLTFEEAKRFVEIVADEDGDDLKVSTTILFDTFEQNFEMLKHAQEVGADSALLGFPLRWAPESEEEVYEKGREMIESAPDLAIVLYETHKFNFERFHASGFPLGLFKRWAELPNAVALKVADPRLMGPIHRECGDRILLACPVEGFLPSFVEAYGMQWIGAGPYEVYQTPGQPILVDYFNALMDGRYDEGMEGYWRLTPIREAFMAHMMPQLVLGTYHWPEHKYYQWLSGGNGGFTRQPAMQLSAHGREEIKAARAMAGIKPPEEDEASYFVGRSNFESRVGAGTA